jgi:hypothetical protein
MAVRLGGGEEEEEEEEFFYHYKKVERSLAKRALSLLAN